MTTRLAELDGFRGLAILCVLVGHVTTFSLASSSPLGMLAAGGVSLFFALSGFLITSLLLREEERRGAVDLQRFYLRRAIRLLPSAWLLIVVVAALKWAGAVTDESWGGIGASFLYVRNVFGRGLPLAHLWSLSLEEQFYLVWPLLFVLVPRKRLEVALALCAAVAAARVVRTVLPGYELVRDWLYLRPWFRFDACLVGCVLALALKRFPQASERRALLAVLAHPLVSGPAFLAVTMLQTSRSLPWSLALQTWLCVPLLYSAVTSGAATYRALLRSPVLRAFGRVSYSAYLWQQLFLVVKQPSWGLWRKPGVDLACACAATLAAYYLVERPCLALKDRVAGTAPTPALGAAVIPPPQPSRADP